jgi:hypothetical protein
MSNWLDKLKNKKPSIETGREYTNNEWDTAYRKYFKEKHGDGPTGLDFAKDYKYEPNVLEKFLDIVPGIGGKRDYERAKDYQDVVHYNPDYSESDREKITRRSLVSGKSMSNFMSVNNEMTDDRFSYGNTVIAEEDPRVFMYNKMLSEGNDTIIDSKIMGGEAGHIAQDRNYNTRSIDPYNIAVAKPGRTVLGFPIGYKGKITSNVAESGGSKLDPYINPQTLKEQVMGNKNLAVANKEFYNNKSNWKIKKEASKNMESFNQRSENLYGK